METVKDYYATAQYFTTGGTSSSTVPAHHRYLLLRGFDEETIKLVNESTLRGEWNLLSGKKEFLDFNRESVSNGRELSEISQYQGQVYKRTPFKKTFLISMQEFREAVFNPAINHIGLNNEAIVGQQSTLQSSGSSQIGI
jgi:hypothetical protein